MNSYGVDPSEVDYTIINGVILLFLAILGLDAICLGAYLLGWVLATLGVV